ncbi:MAG: DUF1543 domain-containing protein [Ignavibacteriaceae bacterium]|jgi:hypothetical protein
MNNLKLFVVLLGCKPGERTVEQHDIFFGVAEELKYLLTDMKAFWPGVDLHIDGYMALNYIGEFKFEFLPKTGTTSVHEEVPKLYFINLGGYKNPELEEYHKKFLIVANSLAEAVSKVKEDPFYLEGQNKSADRSHVDDKEAIDDIICISESLSNFRIELVRKTGDFFPFSETKIGYQSFSNL